MKRAVSLLLILIMSAALTLSCFAEEFVNPPIIDDAGYLMEYELTELSEKIEGIRQKYGFEVAIVTEYEMSGYDAVSTADDIYDYLGYGAGENDDGIMLYICSESREYHITTHADGLRIFNENGIAYLQRNIEPYLSEDDYYSAMDEFANLCDELLAMAANGEVYNEEERDMTYILIVIGAALLIPFIIAKIMTNAKLAKMKTAVQNDYAANYIKEGSKRLDFSRDIFLYSNVTRTAKPKNDSGSHRSSSGRTHGGGGGSF